MGGEARSSALASWLDRALRALLVLGAVVLGYLSVTNTLAQVVVKATPTRAFMLAPRDGLVTAALARQLFTESPGGDSSSRVAQLARVALMREPTAVEAMGVLGLQAQLRDDTAFARRIFSYSRKLSRRELRAQIWTIEESVNRGDIQGALHHYDMALRTSVRAQELLYPVLAAALSEPQIRTALREIMAKNPGWGESFIGYVATSGTDPRAGMSFFRDARRAGLRIAADWSAGLVNSLVAQGAYEEAWGYFASFRPQASRTRSRDPDFELTVDVRTPFDWTTSQDGQLSVAILQGNEGGIVDFFVPSGVNGVLVRQLNLLPPGTYVLEGVGINIDQPERSRPYWSLTCLDGRELGRVPISGTSAGGDPFVGSFVVPSKCTAQTLELVARSSDSAAGLTGQIKRAELRPAGGERLERGN